MTRKYQRSALAQAVLLLLTSFFLVPSFAAGKSPISGVPQATLASDVHYKDSWNFHLSPYFWLAGLSGHVNVQDNRVAFSDSFSGLRHDLDFTFGARFEANQGLWTFLLDPDYVKITQTPALRGNNSKTTYETTITDGGAYYSLYSKPVRREAYSRASFELLGGLRVITAHTVIDFLNNQITDSVADTSSVVVPLLGARFKYNFSPKLHTWINGEVGGFQVSHVSSTWSAALGVSYNVTQHVDLSLAYKALALNYSIQAVTINTLLQGPILGCGYSW